jgi:DNA-binding transcriptional LysR family regulator
MDSELIRTFLEVHRTRHFGRAAERLFVTPAAVSARVRLLEEQLGARLFVRSRNNIGLTAAGQRLLPHAENLLRGWNRAMLSVGTAEADQELVAVGSLHSIWSVLLPGWLPSLYARRPELMVQLELLSTLVLVTRVREQSLDLALVYEAPQARDLTVDAVGMVKLVLVASEPDLNAAEPLAGYVHLDWGTPFSMTLARELPELSDPVLRADAPEVALEFVRARGGAAFLPGPLVQDDLEAGRLYPVAGAPAIERRVYLMESADAEPSDIRLAVRRDLMAWFKAGARQKR